MFYLILFSKINSIFFILEFGAIIANFMIDWYTFVLALITLVEVNFFEQFQCTLLGNNEILFPELHV